MTLVVCKYTQRLQQGLLNRSDVMMINLEVSSEKIMLAGRKGVKKPTSYGVCLSGQRVGGGEEECVCAYVL